MKNEPTRSSMKSEKFTNLTFNHETAVVSVKNEPEHDSDQKWWSTYRCWIIKIWINVRSYISRPGIIKTRIKVHKIEELFNNLQVKFIANKFVVIRNFKSINSWSTNQYKNKYQSLASKPPQQVNQYRRYKNCHLPVHWQVPSCVHTL